MARDFSFVWAKVQGETKLKWYVQGVYLRFLVNPQARQVFK